MRLFAILLTIFVILLAGCAQNEVVQEEPVVEQVQEQQPVVNEPAAKPAIQEETEPHVEEKVTTQPIDEFSEWESTQTLDDALEELDVVE